MSTPENPYHVLGVEPSASLDDIKKTYKKLAMKYHPDRGGDADQFKKISGAYAILSDPQKRSTYDRFGTVDTQPMEMPDINDIFGGLFGFPFGGHPQQQQRQQVDRTLVLGVTLEEVFTGQTIPYRIERKRYKAPRPCPTCNGQGHQLRVLNLGMGMVTQTMTPCGGCQGRGKHYAEYDTAEEIIQVPLPKGIPNGNKLVVRNMGDEYPGQRTGDINLVISYKDHPFYKVETPNLRISVQVTPLEFINGFSKTLRLLDGSAITLRSKGVARELQGLVEKRVKGYGMRYRDSAGDLLVSIGVGFGGPVSVSGDTPLSVFQATNKPGTEKYWGAYTPASGPLFDL